MAFQDMTPPAAILSAEITATRNVLSRIVAFFASLGSSVTMAHSARVRFEQMQALQAKSDEELAAMNIKRDQIVTMVFKDLYYV